MWTRAALGNYISGMMRLLITLLCCFTLLSCQSTKEDDFLSSLDEEEARVILIQSVTDALIASENQAFSEEGMRQLPLDRSYDVYIDELPQFTPAFESWISVTGEVLRNAMESVTDYLMDCIGQLELDPVVTYFEQGYSSVSAELERQCSAQVKTIFLENIALHHDELNEAWTHLEREARIYRENLANLSLVGQGKNIDSIARSPDENLAAWAAYTVFDILSQNEIVIRASMLTDRGE